ncbi:MAG TPA: GH3 auxin-responsive promoter family protein [Candidatus Binatia bacterium]|nr:GH3 auxin-responsive promoter family protein [Candidatus Binatia bacterium]
MSSLINLMFSFLGPRTLATFRDQCRKPTETQERLLNHIVTKNRETAFGKAHRFANIGSFGHFQRRVPIATYDDLKPYIDASLRGEAKQLTAEQPVFFATTSGTTGASKHIPVTAESRPAKSYLMRIWLSALQRDHRVFGGRILTLVSPEVESYAPCGIPCGAESGHAYKNIPKAIKSLYSCPYEVYEIKDYEAKYYCVLRIAAGQSISLIYTCNPSTVLLLGQRLGHFTEPIIRDVRDGTLSREFEVPDDLRAAIEAQLSADPARAASLERAASQGSGRLLPRHVWPELAAIGCWKGGTVGMYVDNFDQYYPPALPVRDIGYFASEHRGSVPMTDHGSSGVLAIPTNVYEFFPVEEDRKPKGAELLTAEELEEGKRYYIYVTTGAGLYRYDMNDIVDVTGFYENTPLLRFVQKGKGVVSFTGEKLYESQVLASVEHAFAPMQGRYEFIAAIGEMRGGKPCYVFLIEFDHPVYDPEAKAMLKSLEGALRSRNMEYASKRDSMRLDSPVLRIIKSGEFDRYRKRAVEKGKSDGQFKILRLTTDAGFAKEFEAEREVATDN